MVKFQLFLQSILDELAPQTIGARFEQQVRRSGGGSIPDGSIFQSSFRIIVETKRSQNFSVPQLQGHLTHFGNEDLKIMLLLSPEALTDKELSRLETEIRSNPSIGQPIANQAIKFVHTTFAKIIDEIRAVLDENRDYEMLDLLNDFSEYCQGENLLHVGGYSMRAVIARYSHVDCLRYNIYYRLRDRKASHHYYVGLYWDKCVRAIGKIESVVEADLEDGELVQKESTNVSLTPEQTFRIKEAMRLGNERGWGVDHGHRFYLVEKFIPTEFLKESSGGMWGYKFFDLKEEVPELFGGQRGAIGTEEIATALKGKTWR